ncbi:hypothetical protein COV42_00930 [Candidatus Campbellbacteria bacterium CG11_big_fil_rev_8_21_14_0_20_44_21]|uniref:Uncharacterized protein n=1 Tax=Candidatus Campbellbacteria bacterium CG22_combo_CG10-13_8_21_14_all_43_18 TaxID=1974530 RepID=A0A2H0DW92_9BACT|nr:MAG: hypothetical protein COW82_02000 [Candidatus Campbellbacteria bacterium CG22_combo_CG10-13_8_21_14_all_43_18]PIR24392.1 MAG: hypothetical protein COV42_00930 [Candidatus Campbellbacteria bacterium CG11_big_fil_rev_8_21_14_0_20_44_21]
MDLSFLLAKILGLFYLILGVIVFKKTEIRKISEELSKNEALRFVFGLIILLIGIIIVAIHNVWSGDWRVLITLLGWLSLVKGFSSLWMDEATYKKWILKWDSKSMVTAGGAVSMVIGLYLSYIGFFI